MAEGRLTTHVLDTARGKPAAGLKILLYRVSGNSHRKITEAVTNTDGRTDAALLSGKALTEGGLRVGYIFGDGRYEAAVFGRNITNQIRVTGAIDFNNLTGFINDPRTYGISFKALF